MFKKFFNWITNSIDKLMQTKIAKGMYKMFCIHVCTINGFIDGVQKTVHNAVIRNSAIALGLSSIIAVPIYGIHSLLNKKYTRAIFFTFATLVVIYCITQGVKAGYFDEVIKLWKLKNGAN